MNNLSLSFGVAMTISNLLPGFKTPTYADEQLVDRVVSLLAIVQEYQKDKVNEVFFQNQLPADEDVDINHPLYREVTESVLRGTCPGTREDFQVFTSESFNGAIEGMQISYADRKLLRYWLVKEEE